jgi:hypothetical protein
MNEFMTVVNACPEGALRLIVTLVTTWSGNFTTLHLFYQRPMPERKNGGRSRNADCHAGTFLSSPYEKG